MCDSTSAINLTKNLVQHSTTNYIEIRHHFIRDHINNIDCEIKFVERAKEVYWSFHYTIDQYIQFFEDKIGNS